MDRHIVHGRLRTGAQHCGVISSAAGIDLNAVQRSGAIVFKAPGIADDGTAVQSQIAVVDQPAIELLIQHLHGVAFLDNIVSVGIIVGAEAVAFILHLGSQQVDTQINGGNDRVLGVVGFVAHISGHINHQGHHNFLAGGQYLACGRIAFLQPHGVLRNRIAGSRTAVKGNGDGHNAVLDVIGQFEFFAVYIEDCVISACGF